MIFIDANIYLRFYDSNSKEYKKLLDSIIEVKGHIFVPDQIEQEVKRNKLNIFSSKMVEYEENSKIKKVHLPEHLQDGTNTAEKWNKKRDEIKQKSDLLIEELKALKFSLYKEILNSEDKVSLSLNEIFENSVEPTSDELNKARYRKEVGNPPGKNSDPLGDQICWEQILTRLKKAKAIWIISNDRDYFNKTKDVDIINPLLFDEAKNENAKLDVFCFTSLAQGLKHFDSNTEYEIKSLPTIEELERIENEEYQPIESSSWEREFYEAAWGLNQSKSNCPYCHTQLHAYEYKDTDFNISGSTSFVYECGNCHKKVYLDTMI